MLGLDNEIKFANGQVGFVEYVLKPFWKQLGRLFDPLKPHVKTLKENMLKYKKIANPNAKPSTPSSKRKKGQTPRLTPRIRKHNKGKTALKSKGKIKSVRSSRKKKKRKKSS